MQKLTLKKSGSCRFFLFAFKGRYGIIVVNMGFGGGGVMAMAYDRGAKSDNKQKPSNALIFKASSAISIARQFKKSVQKAFGTAISGAKVIMGMIWGMWGGKRAWQ